ncbi:MAG: DUF1704 domain-containing protein [Bdellovibrionales bacterium]|nr:DUF1704 domain-containing protein [Bdellovibrionales bacterium]
MSNSIQMPSQAWTTYKEKVLHFSERIVDAQKPIRVLDAIKWDASIERELREGKFKVMPKIGPDYYEKISIGFDPDSKRNEFKSIIQDLRSTLGKEDSVGELLISICDQYLLTVDMLESRGTKNFWQKSRLLYGSPKDTFFGDKNRILDLGKIMYSILGGIEEHKIGTAIVDDVPAEEVVRELTQRFQSYFPGDGIEARLSDGIVADAAAGGDVVKIKQSAHFSRRDIDILEVHEGWVHIGTTQNGSHQKIAKWLSKGPPRVAATQEGLAVIMEIFTFRTYPARARAINDRILGIDKAEEGANLLELIEFYQTEGYSEDECIMNAKRVMRGGVVEGGAPFTKDLSYCRGFIENYNFMRAAIRAGRPEYIPFLFVGKIHVDDIPLLYQKFEEGLIDPPRYVPQPFRDLYGLMVWLSFSSFLNQIDLHQVQEHYDKLFSRYGAK